MENRTNNSQQIQRPQLLTVVAVLSFIGSGLSLFSNLLTILFYDTVVNINIEELKEIYPAMFADPAFQNTLSVIAEAGQSFFAFSTLAYAGSLYGVYKMWHLQKQGLHYYAISQIVILLLPLVFISTEMPVLPSVLLTTLFILLYFRAFKMMEDEK